MPTIWPLSPTYFHQGWVAPASTATRRTTCGGSTLSLYAWSWRSKVVVLGMDTRRTLRPFAAAARTASAAMPTSEPVAMTMTSGGPSESIST